jgi:lipoprotein-anchoring transpeptidase ErfK/SrfK
MGLKITKSKKLLFILAIFVIIILIITGTVVALYYNYRNKDVETLAQQEEDTEEQIVFEQDGEYMDIDELEQQSTGEDAENTEEQNNTTNTNTVTNTTTTTSTTSKNNNIPYYIKVNYGAQVVTIYKKDDNGNYTIPFKAMVCSTGTATPTSGVYSIPARWEWLRLQGYVYGHYSTQITGNILFHSVPYLEKGNKASLEYWEYDKLGTYASAGCIRLTVEDAKWIYNNCVKGTKVEFYSDSNPGPLGKPSAKKISSYPDYLRNWDPTDSDSNNPWKTYNESTKKNDTTQNNTVTNNTVTNNTVTNDTVTNNTATNNIMTNNTVTNNTVTNNTVKDNTMQTNTINSNTINNTQNNTTDANNITQENAITENTVKNNIIQSNTVTNNAVQNNIISNNIISNNTVSSNKIESNTIDTNNI